VRKHNSGVTWTKWRLIFPARFWVNLQTTPHHTTSVMHDLITAFEFNTGHFNGLGSGTNAVAFL
jgi:hypothetical protein